MFSSRALNCRLLSTLALIVFTMLTTGSITCFRFSAALKRFSWSKIPWKSKVCFAFNLFYKSLIIPTFFLVPSVVMLAILFHDKALFSTQSTAHSNEYWPVVVFFIGSKQSSSSMMTKFLSILQIKISNCVVSWLSVVSSGAKENQTKSLLAEFSCSVCSTLIKSMHRTVVLLNGFKLFSHIMAQDVWTIYQTLLNKLAIRIWLVFRLYATMKLAYIALSWSVDCVVNIVLLLQLFSCILHGTFHYQI